ncbi:MAG TPA: hypothetical protein VGP93_01235, partial [Polyangiaceae bacterium]|nr:hypothetical protein [Polyangiaceae bacterium]
MASGGSSSGGSAGSKAASGASGTSGGGGNGGSGTSGGNGSGGTVPVVDGAHPDFTPGEWTVIEPATYCNTPGAYGVTVDPTKPSTIYLVSCGIHKTTDGGSTWKTVGTVTTGPTAPDGHLESPNHLRLDPQNPDHLYVSDGVRGGTQGFWVSDDGGETFYIPDAFAEKANNSVGGWTPDVYDIATDPTDFNHALVSFHSPFESSGTSGILETTDGGESWTRH